jgi:hypothetical protein
MAARFAMNFLCLFVFSASMVAAQSPQPRKDIPAIAKAAKGAIVTIVMANNDDPIARGTGFLVRPDGLIVTNYHVIQTGNVAMVKFADGTILSVDGVVAANKVRDLAIIKIRGKSFRTLTFGNSDRIQIGEDVVAIGNPLGLELTVSNGILSGIRTDEKEGGKFLQITAPISHGSSGGPLFNMFGEVVGINSMYLEGGENLNFAIPANDAKNLLRNQSAKLQALPNEPDLNAEKPSDATSPPASKVIANERLRAFRECPVEHNPYDYSIMSYPSECVGLVISDFREWAVQQGLDHEAETLAMSEVVAYRQRGELYSHLEYNGDWSRWLGREAVEQIGKLNSKPYAVRIAVLKDSTKLVDKYVLHVYEVTNP